MNNSFEQEFSARIQKKLDAVEMLRQNLTIEHIEVPGVVVIGAQSAGMKNLLLLLLSTFL